MKLTYESRSLQEELKLSRVDAGSLTKLATMVPEPPARASATEDMSSFRVFGPEDLDLRMIFHEDLSGAIFIHEQ